MEELDEIHTMIHPPYIYLTSMVLRDAKWMLFACGREKSENKFPLFNMESTLPLAWRAPPSNCVLELVSTCCLFSLI